MSRKGQHYSRYSSTQMQQVLRHHKIHPKDSRRKIALIYDIACPETVRYWIKKEENKKSVKKSIPL